MCRIPLFMKSVEVGTHSSSDAPRELELLASARAGRVLRGSFSQEVLAALGAVLVLALSVAPAQAQTPYTQSRASSFEYYGASDGVKNGLLKTETVEPGDAQLCVTTTYTYDAYGNKAGASTSNCAGAASNVLFAPRTSASTYAAQTVTVAGVSGVAIPAGTLPTSSTNALGHGDSKIYDPRFGAAVTLTGPNALTTTWTLDDFGRVITETRADGTRSVSYYCYIASRANDSSNTPGCPTPGGTEVPDDAVAFVHKESRDNSAAPGIKNGPFSRVYTDRAGRQIRTVTEAFDGATQPGGISRLIVQETVYSIYGTPNIATQPYFLDSSASTASGNVSNAPYGMRCTEYDVLGRPVVVYSTDPAATGTVGGSQACASFGSRQASKATVVYSGLNVTTTDDKGNTRLEEKNVDGKVVRVTDALGAQVAYQHDAFGNLLTTQDALQNQVRVAYDKRGRKVSMVDPDAGVWGYCYDAVGQIVAQQNSKMRGGNTPGACPATPNNAGGSVATSVAGWTTMAYDKLGRVKSRIEPEYTSTWSYDTYADGSACTKGVGKLCEVNSSNGVNRKSVYDSLGRPLNSRTTIASGPSFASVVGYDSVNGRLVSQTYPTGLQVKYGYTNKGFLKHLALGTTATVTPLPATPGGTPVAGTTLAVDSFLWQAKAYNAWGRAEQQAYGNDVLTNAVFEASTGRITNLTAGIGGATNVLNHSYAWDSIGRMAQRNDDNGAASDTPSTVGGVADIFEYDAIGRLKNYTVSANGIPNQGRIVTLQYNALGMTLYKSDVGNYAYGAAATAGVRPHALQSVAGAVTTNYGYDANGNLVTASAGKYASISYTSFNLPDSNTGAQGPGGTPKYTWQYDENHQRIKEVEVSAAGTRTTWNLHPDNQGGLGFESESSTASPTPSNRHYLSVGGMSIGVLVSSGALPSLTSGQTQPTAISSITLVKVEYWHKDMLGSLMATTNHQGGVTKVYSYDPFGKRRQAKGSYDSFGNVVIDWTTNTDNGTDRGYTGHEHMDDIGIIHMNGRTFDPTLGRFMQGDPLIQDPLNLQNYDRYGYCFNNPITCSDPSGTSFNPINLVRWIDPIGFKLTSAVAHNEWGYMIGSMAIGVVSVYYCGAAGPTAAAGCNAAGQAAWAGFAGKSFEQQLKTGAIAGVTTYAFAQAGDFINAEGAFAGGTNYGQGSWQAVAVHAAVGCGTSAIAGGRCQDGALSAAFSEAVMGNIPKQDIVTGTVIASVVGGTASQLGGGKFSSGAITGAFSYLFNSALHDRQAGTTRAEIQGNYAASSDYCLSDYCLGVGYMFTPDALHLSVTIYDSYSGILTIDGQPRGCTNSIVCLNYVPIDGQKQSKAVWGPFKLETPTAMGNDSFAQALRNTAAAWSNGTVPYRLNSTSNTFVGSILAPIYGTAQTFNFLPFQAPGYGGKR